MTTVNEIIKDSLLDIGAIGVGETPDDDTIQHALRVLRKMINGWSNKRQIIYFSTTENFTLTGAASYTIGSGGDFNAVRPVKIQGAYTRSSGVDNTLKIIDEAQWREITLKGTVAPSSWLWYSPEYPLGKIYIYPLEGGTIYLHSLKHLTDYTALTTTLSLPEGYEEAIQYNLALRLAPGYGKGVDVALVALAKMALDDIKRINASLNIETVKPEIFRLTRRYSINEG